TAICRVTVTNVGGGSVEATPEASDPQMFRAEVPLALGPTSLQVIAMDARGDANDAIVAVTRVGFLPTRPNAVTLARTLSSADLLVAVDNGLGGALFGVDPQLGLTRPVTGIGAAGGADLFALAVAAHPSDGV